jgi:alpha-1,2-mannosyltransferase
VSARTRGLPWLVAAAVVVAAAMPVVLRYLVFWPLDQWQVDVEVYREAGVSVLTGRPVYAAMTEPPQLLAFTYPPFAALLAVPLALVPFGVAGWLWTGLQVAATAAIVWYAGWRLIHHARLAPWPARLGLRRLRPERLSGSRWRVPLLLGLLTAPMLWLHPVSDGIRFGQVNAFMVLACLMDLRRPRPRLLRAVPPGVLVGLAMSVKLTPGVFVVHYLVNRRWREAATALGAAAAVTAGAWAVLPEASFAFWGGALQDPQRLGPNMGTSNQSLRGFLLRVGPEGGAGTLLWLLSVVAVGCVGYAVARRAWRAGDSISEVAAMGLMAVLLSPVAWIHHFHWMVVVVFAVLGADPFRDRRRLAAGAVVTAWFLCRMPWWGISWLNHGDWPELPGRALQNADTFGALLALALLACPSATEQAEELQAADRGDEQADRSARAAHRRQRDPGQQHPPHDGSESGDRQERRPRSHEDGEAVVVADRHRGGEQLGQVPPLGQEEHREARRHGPPAARPGGALGGELALLLRLLLPGA